MIKRTMEPYLLDRAQKLPVLAILGPRQSGKLHWRGKHLKNINIFHLKNQKQAIRSRGSGWLFSSFGIELKI